MATEMDEKRAEIKAHLESFEHWSRRLINDEMTIRYGKDYFNIVLPDGNSFIKQEIIKRIEERMRDLSCSGPGRAPIQCRDRRIGGEAHRPDL